LDQSNIAGGIDFMIMGYGYWYTFYGCLWITYLKGWF